MADVLMRRTDKTLLEQMQISDIEIQRRKELLGLNEEHLARLPAHRLVMEEHLESIVDEFYQRQTEIDEITLLIGDADTLHRLRSAQRRYIIDLFSGHYDSEYVNNRLRIGMVHKRIGVEPKLYLSAVRTLKDLIVGVLTQYIVDRNDLEPTLEALDKLLYFDTTLVFDTYISSLVGEIETAKKRTEDYAKSLEDKVAERTRQLEAQAKMDPLTNLYNQKAMRELLRREIATAQRQYTKLAIAYFDIDKFKDINDKHGHIKGDEVLKYLGQFMLSSIRSIDIACRYGGDEFCLVLPQCDVKAAKHVCQKIIEKFKEKFPHFSLTVGITETGPDEFDDIELLIRRADERMYTAKAAGTEKQVA